MIGRVTVISIVFCFLFITGANGDVYEFELPEVAGVKADTTLTTTFIYHGSNGAINSLSATVMGTVDYLGLVECTTFSPDTSEWALDVGTFLRKPGDTGRWLGSPGFLVQVGSFNETYIHQTYSGGFSTIADGDTVEVEMYFLASALVGGCHPITPPSMGTLSRASILVDVSTPTPVQRSAWGRIKALFRAPN